MKIKNQTHWRTDQLRALINRVAKDEMVSLKGAKFVIKYKRQMAGRPVTATTGWACYGMPPRVRLNIPRDTIDAVRLAFVIAHELAHSQYVHHRSMLKTSIYRWGGNWEQHFAWAATMPIEKIIPTAKPAVEAIIQRKLSKAMKMAERWRMKAKRSQTIFKKWSRKVSYYDRQLVKAAVQPDNKQKEGQ